MLNLGLSILLNVCTSERQHAFRLTVAWPSWSSDQNFAPRPRYILTLHAHRVVPHFSEEIYAYDCRLPIMQGSNLVFVSAMVAMKTTSYWPCHDNHPQSQINGTLHLAVLVWVIVRLPCIEVITLSLEVQVNNDNNEKFQSNLGRATSQRITTPPSPHC